MEGLQLSLENMVMGCQVADDSSSLHCYSVEDSRKVASILGRPALKRGSFHLHYQSSRIKGQTVQDMRSNDPAVGGLLHSQRTLLGADKQYESSGEQVDNVRRLTSCMLGVISNRNGGFGREQRHSQ